MSIMDKLVASNRTWTLHAGGEGKDGANLATVRSHFSFSPKFNVNFTNAKTGQPVELTLRGTWTGRYPSILTPAYITSAYMGEQEG